MTQTIAAAILLATAFGSMSSAHSAVIDVPPPTHVGSYPAIASNSPRINSVYAGVAQSFIAQDSRVSFGYYLVRNSTGQTPVEFRLYAGDGEFTHLLALKSAQFQASALTETFVSVDFSDVSLVANSKYTVAITLPDAVLPPPEDQFPAEPEMFAALAGGFGYGTPNNPYTGGSFYYFGSIQNQGVSPDWDLAFRVTPMPVPEPATALIWLAGLGALTVHRRKRGAARVSS